MSDPIPARNDSISRQMASARSLLDMLGRVISQSSNRLTRLLRIAKEASGFNVGRLTWTRPAARARQTRLPTRTVNAIQAPPFHAPSRYPPTPAFLDPAYRPALSTPLQVALPFPPSLASLLFKRPGVPNGYIPARSRQVNGPSGRQAGAAALPYFQSNRSRGTQSISPPANTQHLVSWLAGFSPTYGRPPPPHEHRRAPKPEHRFPVTTPSYPWVGHETSNAMTKLAKTPAGAVSITQPSRTTAASRESTASNEPHFSSGGTGNGNKSSQGELVLEASMLGRWLTQQLNREIVRPPTGMIGVDPRMTPAWVGPSFGT